MRLFYFERYLAGEHEAVWRELIELGDQVFQPPLREECVRVCDEVVRRARFNLRLIHSRLRDLGYEFADPEASLVEAGPNAVAEIEKVEEELGAVSLIVQAWYRTFASVNFSQAEHQLLCTTPAAILNPPPAPDIFGLGSHSVLVFQSLDRCLEEVQQSNAAREENLRYAKEQGWDEEDLPESVDSGKFIPLGGVASNCEPKGLELPCFGIDGVLYDDGHTSYFMDELRLAFQWGGFPFWKNVFKRPKFYAPMHYRPNFERLLPILKEGLLEI